MSANSPSSYSLSLMLHGAFVAAILFTAYAFKDETTRKSTEIFELVAGAGENWAATEAPAEGSPSGVKFQASPKPVVQPKPQPVAPAPEPEAVVRPAPVEASPVTPSPVEAVAPPKVEPKKTPPQKTFAQQVTQIANQKERALLNKHRREVAAREKKEAAERAKREAAEAAKKKATMTKEEFDRLNGKKVASNTKSASADYEKVSTKGIVGGAAGGTTDQAGAGGTVLSRAEQDQLATYFAMLKQRLLAAHEKPLGVSDQLSARVSFYIAASGAISQAKIVKSSGNAEFDQSVLATFRAVGSIGKRPDNRSDSREVTFDLRDIQ